MRPASVTSLPSLSAVVRCAAFFLCALSVFVLAGWAIGNPLMVRLLPDSTAMVLNSALLFLTCGVCLFLGNRRRGRTGRLYRHLPVLLFLLPLAVLFQHVFDVNLGVDLARFHAGVGDGHGRPGRMSPNASLGFLLAGSVFVLTRKAVLGAGAYRVSLLLSTAIFALGATAFSGYLFDLDALYQIASFNRTAPLTALGMTVAGIGTWALTAKNKPYGTAASLADARQITGLAAGLLSVFALAAGMTVFGILKNSYENSAIERIGHGARTSALSISALLDKAILLSQSVSTRPSLAASVAALNSGSNDAQALEMLVQESMQFIALGFSSVQVYDNGNSLLLNLGASVRNLDDGMSMEITSAQESNRLIWHNGFFLQNGRDLVHEGEVVGRIAMERQMQEFTEFLFEAQHISKTSDLLLCSRERDISHCYPSRFYDARQFPILVEGEQVSAPMALALTGEMGAAVTKDGRGITVLAGYAPVPGYELGLVEKVDAEELYAPLDETLPYLLIAVAVFIAIGTLLLRQWVMPLITRIVSERQRMKGILNTSNDAFIAINAAGLITDWNAEAERIFGWTATEAIGQSFVDLLIAEESHPQWEMQIQRFIGSSTLPSKSRRMEIEALDRTGRQLPVELSVSPFHDEDGYAVAAFLRDLTLQKQAEQSLDDARGALLQSQKLEAVGKLTGGVAHDFNNVLQVIKGTLQLLQVEHAGDAKVIQRADTAMSAVDRGAKLAAELLAFARRHPLQPRVTNLGTVLRRMDDMLQRVLGESVEVETVVAAGLWNTYTDPHQLEQVLLNLAINARDAMEGEGRLTVEVGNAVLDDDYARGLPDVKPGQYVMIAISDTGCGMPDEIAERVFEPFFTTKPEGKGTGLGLSMVYGFAKQSGGHIRIYSEVGSGTTVRLYLPRSFEKEEDIPVRTSCAVTGGNETILVVEDDATVQITAVELLRSLGYRVLKANNAEMALEILKQGAAVDLLFTDVVMPGSLRSPDMARRAQAMLPELKVLFTSGYTQNAIVHGGRLDPGVHLLSKPYSREQLARKLRELLADRKVPEPAQEAAEASTTMQSLRIAFVEDHAEFRMLGSEMLVMLGYQVQGFARAEDALEPLQQGRFDVLLSDARLPGMSGQELAARAVEAQPALRVILTSGSEAALSAVAGFSYETLLKPFTLSELQAVLQTLREQAP
jgi:PAS domain S-box-containing protein